MMSGAQKSPRRFSGTALVCQGRRPLNTRGPLVQLIKSFERQETTPLPVAKVQYSSLHFTIVDGSGIGTFRLPARASTSAASTGELVSCAEARFNDAAAINARSAD